jgi:hypothetical protein
MPNPTILFTALLALSLAYLLGSPLLRTATVFGIGRTPKQFPLDAEIVSVPDTVHCEDIHYHAPTHKLFTACEDDASTRFAWFPPLARFDYGGLKKGPTGSLHVIDPDVSIHTIH